jgi:hypothetical protein
MSGYSEVGIFAFPGGRGAQLVETPPPDPDLATPAKIEEARRAGIAEVPFEDFTIRQSAPQKYIFTDSAGNQYRRAPEHNPLANGDTLAARGISCFTVDAGGRMHYLRRRGEGNPSRVVHHGPVYGRRLD